MFHHFQELISYNITLFDVLLNITVALLCGLIISFVYRATYRGPNYSATFVNAMIILSMITSVVIMVIGNNLARAFGLVGAMSIIRFRTAVKDTQDIVFIFFSLAVGMAAGVGFHIIAVSGSLFIGVIYYILNKIDLVNPNRKEFLLQFSSTNSDPGDDQYLEIFGEYCKSHKLINMKASDDDFEFTYYIQLKDNSQSAVFLQALKQLKSVQHLNLFFDEEQF